MSRNTVYFFIIILFFTNALISQQASQNIRGLITDNKVHFPLSGVTICLLKDSTIISQTSSNKEGTYKIENVAVGIYKLRVSTIGYETLIFQKIIIDSGKENITNIEMEEKIYSFSEIAIINTKSNDVSEWTNNSVKKFTPDETNRYAGSRSDPARMVSNFAGVLGADDSRNDIVIRGNSPLGMVWRFEGVDIPNPNHFAIIGNTGAPVSILNNKTLTNSTFFTGAFPAEYGNTVAGVFDLKMRKGNNEKIESTFQLGLLGTEILTEGMLTKKKKASFLISYRYSTLQLFESFKIPIGTEAVPKYQDMALNLNFPLSGNANFTVFAIGGLSKINTIVSTYTNPDKELYTSKDKDQYFNTGMGLIGASFTKPINTTTFLKIVVATTQANSYDHDNLVYRNFGNSTIDSIIPKIGYYYKENRASLNIFLNKKFNSKFSIQTGSTICRYYFNMLDSTYNQLTYKFNNQINYKGATYLIQPYIQSTYKINSILNLKTGVHFQKLTLNNSYSIEPRACIKFNVSDKSSLSLSAGMHSQMQPTYNYFYHLPETNDLHNINLGFTKSNHLVFTYDRTINKSFQLKLESYYQYLYNVPIEVVSSSFSLINQGLNSKPFYPRKLTNAGTGKNYGLEMTIEKLQIDKMYFLFSASLYNSKYKGSDHVERDTDFNRNFALNLLCGNSFKINARKTFEIGGKITYAGGRKYTPIDELASKFFKENIFIDSLTNTNRFKPYFRFDIKLNLKINKKNLTHDVGFDLVNVLNTKNIFSISYSNITNKIIETYQLGLLPIFYYKIDF